MTACVQNILKAQNYLQTILNLSLIIISNSKVLYLKWLSQICMKLIILTLIICILLLQSLLYQKVKMVILKIQISILIELAKTKVQKILSLLRRMMKINFMAAYSVQKILFFLRLTKKHTLNLVTNHFGNRNNLFRQTPKNNQNK